MLPGESVERDHRNLTRRQVVALPACRWRPPPPPHSVSRPTTPPPDPAAHKFSGRSEVVQVVCGGGSEVSGRATPGAPGRCWGLSAWRRWHVVDAPLNTRPPPSEPSTRTTACSAVSHNSVPSCCPCSTQLLQGSSPDNACTTRPVHQSRHNTAASQLVARVKPQGYSHAEEG